MFKEDNLNLSYSMKYLIPKIIVTGDLEILESKSIFKIKNTNNPIHLFGIPILLKGVTIIKNYEDNRYYIVLNDVDNDKIQHFNSFLSNIENYKDITEIKKINGIKENVLIIYPNNSIEKYFSQKITEFYINIKYVKKSGFFNYPVLNIL